MGSETPAGQCEVCQRPTPFHRDDRDDDDDAPAPPAPPAVDQAEADDALFAACAVSCERCALGLLRAGARTEARDGEHCTPLMQAAQRGAVKALRLLLEWRCQVSH